MASQPESVDPGPGSAGPADPGSGGPAVPGSHLARQRLWLTAGLVQSLIDKSPTIPSSIRPSLSPDAASCIVPHIAKKIARDKHRTFAHAALISDAARDDKEDLLEDLLLALTLILPLGYCQGMNVVVASCIDFFAPPAPPDAAFWLAFRLLSATQGLFAPGMPAFDATMAWLAPALAAPPAPPALAAAMDAAGVVPLMFASAWLHTLFAHDRLPPSITAAVWDASLDRDSGSIDPLVFPAAAFALTLCFVEPIASLPPGDTMALLDVFRSPHIIAAHVSLAVFTPLLTSALATIDPDTRAALTDAFRHPPYE